jgi:hypothetical protein
MSGGEGHWPRAGSQRTGAAGRTPEKSARDGSVGPPLDGLRQRPFLAGQLANTLDVLVAFLQNPPALVPPTGMPDVGQSEQDARDIGACLYTLPPAGTRHPQISTNGRASRVESSRAA